MNGLLDEYLRHIVTTSQGIGYIYFTLFKFVIIFTESLLKISFILSWQLGNNLSLLLRWVNRILRGDAQEHPFFFYKQELIDQAHDSLAKAIR